MQQYAVFSLPAALAAGDTVNFRVPAGALRSVRSDDRADDLDSGTTATWPRSASTPDGRQSDQRRRRVHQHERQHYRPGTTVVAARSATNNFLDLAPADYDRILRLTMVAGLTASTGKVRALFTYRGFDARSA